jgi:hypothetical protein
MFAIVSGTTFVGPFESEEDASAHLAEARNLYVGVSTTIVRLVDPEERVSVADDAQPVEVDEPNAGDSTATSDANLDDLDDSNA